MQLKQYEFSNVLALAQGAIAIPSVSGDEAAVFDYFTQTLQSWGWNCEQLPVEGDRYNLFCSFGLPRVLFTTHLDVVPAPASLFVPRQAQGRLFGRGACDAKGIAAAMAGACQKLSQAQENNFGLLLVVGEERDGIGARTAAVQLKDRGIEFLINGEPTERKMVLAHKGMLRFRVNSVGKSGHSGYPEAGDDANAKLIRYANKLLDLDLGRDPLLGAATVNVGVIGGGVACNVISSAAHLECVVRLVGPPEEALEKIREIVGTDGTISDISAVPPAHMETLPGFQTSVVAYSTDIPNFSALKAKTFLYGPGSIDVAHTDDEFIELEDLEAVIEDYERIFRALT